MKSLKLFSFISSIVFLLMIVYFDFFPVYKTTNLPNGITYSSVKYIEVIRVILILIIVSSIALFISYLLKKDYFKKQKRNRLLVSLLPIFTMLFYTIIDFIRRKYF